MGSQSQCKQAQSKQQPNKTQTMQEMQTMTATSILNKTVSAQPSGGHDVRNAIQISWSRKIGDDWYESVEIWW